MSPWHRSAPPNGSTDPSEGAIELGAHPAGVAPTLRAFDEDVRELYFQVLDVLGVDIQGIRGVGRCARLLALAEQLRAVDLDVRLDTLAEQVRAVDLDARLDTLAEEVRVVDLDARLDALTEIVWRRQGDFRRRRGRIRQGDHESQLGRDISRFQQLET